MSTPDTPKKTNRRQKMTTELGRQLMQAERKRLAKEQAKLGEKLAITAQEMRNRRVTNTKHTPKQQVGLNRSVVRRTAAVLASEEVNVPIHVTHGAVGDPSTAWTDFKKIQVTYMPRDDVRLLAAELRGLLYHEGGHCRFTLLPFLELVMAVKEELAMTDSLAPLPLPPDVTPGDYAPLRKAWNCLEDQRMETAVVSDAPRKAAFFTPLVMGMHLKDVDAMAANYPLLIWRRYLPSKLLRQARKAFVAKHGDKGEQLAKDLARIVTKYVVASDVMTMWEAVCAYHTLLQDAMPLASEMQVAGHRSQNQRGIRKSGEFDLTIPIDPSMLHDMDDMDDSNDGSEQGSEQSTDEKTEGDPGNQTGADESEEKPEEGDMPDGLGSTGDVEGDGDNGAQGNESEQTEQGGSEQGDPEQGGSEQDDSNDGEKGGASGSHTDRGEDVEEEPFTQDDLNEMLQEAEEERYNQRDLDADVEAYTEAVSKATSDLDTYIGGVSTDAALITQAETLAQHIEEAFHAHTMDRAPAWVEQQRRGVLNVQRYVTRQPGEVEFFKQWTEDDQPGFDIAVSVYLDYSSSMSWKKAELAQCGYACKLACDKLGIPCTVVLWDTHARVLWDAQERAETMPVIGCSGGTDPTTALADLDNQRLERSKHLVLIMTDGDWFGEWEKDRQTLAYLKDDGRLIFGFGFGDASLAKGLLNKGCDEALAITDLLDIPFFLEQALLDLT